MSHHDINVISFKTYLQWSIACCAQSNTKNTPCCYDWLQEGRCCLNQIYFQLFGVIMKSFSSTETETLSYCRLQEALQDILNVSRTVLRPDLYLHPPESFFLNWFITHNIYKMYKDKLQNCSCNQFHYISTYKEVKTNSMTKNRGGNNGSEKWIEKTLRLPES